MTPEPMVEARAGRVLGVDAGTVRVGVALSDPGRRIATPLQTVAVGKGKVAARIAAIAREQGCDTVVVGLPHGLSGADTASTQAARALAETVRSHGLRVEVWDERFTSVEAERMLVSAGRRRAQRRGERDRVAAAIILQGWLDAQVTGG